MVTRPAKSRVISDNPGYHHRPPCGLYRETQKSRYPLISTLLIGHFHTIKVPLLSIFNHFCLRYFPVLPHLIMMLLQSCRWENDSYPTL